MRKPNFFIIGAPKCGTTSLAHWLSQHPNAYITDPKEPFYFSPDVVKSDFTTKKQYLTLYSRAKERHIAIGEASTTYLRSEVAVEAILDFVPSPKFIVMLRNPIDMALSLHNQELCELNETESDFWTAWNLQDERSAGRRIPLTCTSAELLQYKKICSVGTQLEKLYSICDPAKVHLIFLEEVKQNPAEVFRGVENFLGIPGCNEIEFVSRNERKQIKSQSFARMLKFLEIARVRIGIPGGTGLLTHFHRINKQKKKSEGLENALRLKLTKAFESEICLLEKLTETDLTSWRC